MWDEEARIHLHSVVGIVWLAVELTVTVVWDFAERSKRAKGVRRASNMVADDVLSFLVASFKAFKQYGLPHSWCDLWVSIQQSGEVHEFPPCDIQEEQNISTCSSPHESVQERSQNYPVGDWTAKATHKQERSMQLNRQGTSTVMTLRAILGLRAHGDIESQRFGHLFWFKKISDCPYCYVCKANAWSRGSSYRCVQMIQVQFNITLKSGWY